VGIGWVKVKMLPFDNKSEFQIILNMPEGSALERTAQAAREIAAAVRTEPEVTDYQIYAGVASPFNFNGLVRHYFMRRGANVADIQVNLVPRANARRRVTTSPSASARAWWKLRRSLGRASPWPKCRPGRRCCKRSSPKFTGQRRKRAMRWRTPDD
jgi:multidrug efflux pump subunit AcrB